MDKWDKWKYLSDDLHKHVKAYEAFLDATYGEFKIGETSFEASDILWELDKIAYNEGLLNFADGEELND